MLVEAIALNEFQLIEKYFTASQRGDAVLLGVGDDAAIVDVPSGYRLVVSVDTIVEGMHFPFGTSAADIAYRALAVNLSDMAAMGAIPKWFTLSLCIPSVNESWLASFADSMHELASQFNVQLIGGDTVKGSLNISIQILGVVESDRWLTRTGAKLGDLICISGIPGEAAGGLQMLLNPRSSLNELQQHCAQQLIHRFNRPMPRVNLGRQLRLHASSAMDVSDGLLTDLKKLCAASGCGARLQIDQLPSSSALNALFDAHQCEQLTLCGGDDYELLFTIAPSELPRLKAAVTAEDSCTVIGEITRDREVGCFRGEQLIEIADTGFDHFKD